MGRGLDKVLDKRLQPEDDILEAFDLLEIVDKLIHRALALSEFHPPVFVPEIVAPHHHVGIAPHLSLALKQLLGQFVEAVVAHTGGTDDKGLAEELGEGHLDKHIVDGQHPLAIG